MTEAKMLEHFSQRKHILFERLDAEGNFEEMMQMLTSDKILAQFLLDHLEATDGIFEWNVKTCLKFKEFVDARK